MLIDTLAALLYEVICSWLLLLGTHVGCPRIAALASSADTFSTPANAIGFISLVALELIASLFLCAGIICNLKRLVEDIKALRDPVFSKELVARREREASLAISEAEESRKRKGEEEARKEMEEKIEEARRREERARREWERSKALRRREGEAERAPRKSVAGRFGSPAELVDLFSSDPAAFEQFVALVYRGLGYAASVTPPRRDGGYDILLTRGSAGGAPKTSIVECKCFGIANTVGRPLLQKLYGANATKRADEMVFVTTSSFSKGARAYARETRIKLVDGHELIRLANSAGTTRKDAERLRRA